MTRVGVVGIGHGVFGRRSDATVQELAFEAYRLGFGRCDLPAQVGGADKETPGIGLQIGDLDLDGGQGFRLSGAADFGF